MCNECRPVLPSRIANWKNNAKGAYSIIHDDYGNTGVDGIWQYADTIASNRGIKFTFGAISGDCEVFRNVNGQPTPYAYAKNVMMAQHNHEIINHSHTHTCAVGRGWSPCSGTGWGEVVGAPMWNTELNTSHSSIITGTGFTPRYFIFPYDQFTDAANTELYNKGYLGSRTGWSVDGVHSSFYKYGYEANDENLFKCDVNGFFRTSVQVFDDVDRSRTIMEQIIELNEVVNDAVANNEWGNRELHNVGPEGWGTVNIEAYRQHLNYVQQRVASGDLWVPTMSEALTYQIQKLVYTPSANFNISSNQIDVTFTEDNTVMNKSVEDYLAPLEIKTPITLVLDVTAYKGIVDFSNVVVKQNGTTIQDVKLDGNDFLVNLYPSNGPVSIGEDVTTSVETVSNDSEFSVYPNPANDIIFVKGDVFNIPVYSSVGKLLMSTNGNHADLSGLTSGVYFVKINNSGTLKKFVKL